MSKCPQGQVADFLTVEGKSSTKKGSIRCLDQCPPGTQKKEKAGIDVCTKPDEDLKLSESLLIQRGVRRATAKKDMLANDFSYRYFPNRVVGGSDKTPHFNISIDPKKLAAAETKKAKEALLETTLQSNDYAACTTAAKNMKIARLGDRRIFGTFDMMANVQRNGTLAKDVFIKCRDVAHCKIHAMNKNEKKLAGCKKKGLL